MRSIINIAVKIVRECGEVEMLFLRNRGMAWRFEQQAIEMTPSGMTFSSLLSPNCRYRAGAVQPIGIPF